MQELIATLSESMIFRNFCKEDTAKVIEFHERVLKETGVFVSGPWNDDMKKIEEVYIHPGGCFVLIEEAGSIVAMGALNIISATEAEIKRMRVETSRQRQGLGQIILDYLISYAEKQGTERIILDTTELQIAAQQFYLKNHFVKYDKVTWNGITLILYEKWLRQKNIDRSSHSLKTYVMNRAAWLIEKRREVEERYDIIWAQHYDEKWGTYPNEIHQQFIQKFLSLLPQHSAILDAACGVGRYMSTLLGKGHTVVGIDQSRGMLSRAVANFPKVKVEKIGLQEMSYSEAFDGIICMDAMENIFPEDWPLVLNNFHKALKPHGYLYFTVEIADDKEIEEAFNMSQQSGFPVFYGELADGEVYHYYPVVEQVKEWIEQAGFNLMEEGIGDSYRHFVIRKHDHNREE